MALGADGGMNGDRHIVRRRGHEDAEVRFCQPCLAQACLERRAHAESRLHARDERIVHLTAGFFGHAKRAVLQPGRDVLGRSTEPRDLVVMNGR